MILNVLFLFYVNYIVMMSQFEVPARKLNFYIQDFFINYFLVHSLQLSYIYWLFLFSFMITL